MPATLGELYETADRNLRSAARLPLTPDDARGHAAAVRLLGELVGHLRTTLESAGERPRRASPGPATHLATAQSALRRAARRLPAVDDEAALHGTPLARAAQAAAAVQDLIASHRGRDGVPVTPYAFAFAERSARAYLVHCSAELAWGAARVAQAVGEAVTTESTAVQLHVVRGSLDLASVVGRAASRDEDRALAAFPLALPLDPRPALSTDAAGSIPAHLADDCERLSRAAFEALHGRGEPGLSGSDLQQMARWRAMSNLLSGRTLLHTAAHADPDTAEGLREAADRLRTAAQAWQQVAARWHRVVDLADPRAHPKLPLPSYDLVRSGQFTPMPKTPPHPALVTAQANATRLGQLLYGTAWNPETPARPVQRDARELLADAGGLAGLTQTLYRVSATGWQLAVAMPAALRRIESTLVTDNADHRPPGAAHRFYPLPSHQTERLAEGYEQVMEAEQATATSILRTAPHTGMDTARARLDAAAHSQIRSGQPWLPVDTAAERQAGTMRPSAQAARAPSTTVAKPARRSPAEGEAPSHLRRASGEQQARKSTKR
ncbi:hypothetical protein [Streptomyces ipomoeae]|uniref:hypothetical protein n=1 Tax=Streptomyces ipomoeae TaxID=103232 RepID=UPI0029B6B911|nr:hypothetical protein [Streptomyces ipomoeae]MDX2692174.1 hypothetical protein [Streptomyces ipomoeae]MDX2839281.1 hypothetical protein [Streptomyces ipomoeae]